MEKNNHNIVTLDFEINDDIELTEDKIAYSQAINELRSGETIKLDDYLKIRSIY
jgi:hypothetical protein